MWVLLIFFLCLFQVVIFVCVNRDINIFLVTDPEEFLSRICLKRFKEKRFFKNFWIINIRRDSLRRSPPFRFAILRIQADRIRTSNNDVSDLTLILEVALFDTIVFRRFSARPPLFIPRHGVVMIASFRNVNYSR